MKGELAKVSFIMLLAWEMTMEGGFASLCS
jgi:hypothetical protein